MASSDALVGAVRARALPGRPHADALAVARGIAEKGGDDVRGVVFFGSRKTRAGPDPWSAYDFFVLTRTYRGFYRALRSSGSIGRNPLLVAALNAILPPNQISVAVPRGAAADARAKCAVISLDGLLRETSARRRDHFCIGRLFQPAEIVHAADDATSRRILEALVSAHVETYRWVRPWLPARFDVDGYTRTLLTVSLGREIRPEPEGRADALWEAQKADLRDVYAILLADLAAAGELVAREAGVYALARPVGRLEGLRVRAYFTWSLVRATVRWFKYVVTFEGWLDYIVRKAERHTGEPIALTPRERRWPMIFLWPRLVGYLRHKDERRRTP